MKKFGTPRLVRYGSAAAVLGTVATVVAIAAIPAQATPNKPYLANVHQTSSTFGSMTLTLTNDPHASQSLGSANFTPPSGLTVTGVTTPNPLAGWTVSVDNVGIVEFRSSSSSNALGPGGQVSAVVTVSRTDQCTATAGSATWKVEAKQSNSFSGPPGNDLTLNPASDLTPLGSFAFAPIETVIAGPNNTQIHVPQIKTNQAAPITLTALDTCGNTDTDYSGGTFAAVSGLAAATFAGPVWTNGVTNPDPNKPTTTVTPVDVEVGDQFSITDSTTGIFANSSSTDGRPTFDVVETICAAGDTCIWSDKNNNGIKANSNVPSGNNGEALGLGFKQFANGDKCNLKPPLGDSIEIDPFGYGNGETLIITLTYAKSTPIPNGPASSFIACKSDEGSPATWTPIGVCPKVPVPDCYVSSNLPGGALQIKLYLDPADPHSGGFGP